MFQFGKDLFDGVEVWGIGRQEQKPGSGGPDGAAHRLALVATEIVEDDDVARLQRWKQNLVHIGPQARPVDWTIENPWGLDTITPQGGEEGHCLPVTVRDLCREPAAPRAPTSDWSHVGLDPGVSRPEGFHLRPLADRCVNLSIHTAPIRRTCWFRMFASARRGPHFPAPAFAGKDWREVCGTESGCP